MSNTICELMHCDMNINGYEIKRGTNEKLIASVRESDLANGYKCNIEK